ncbi:MAG: DUF4290 domain-containing protein [Bacteroidetes bacterium]|nr:DUF4290 domain-containing protein [Bacteroidota bacterium]
MIDPEYYNTQREKLRISEYGRNVQDMVAYIKSIDDKSKRSLIAAGVVNVMATLNPQLKDMSDYKQKLWDHLFAIADYDLDVDCPFPIPEREAMNRKPDSIPYQDNMIRFRFYGRNVQNMVIAASEMEEGETRTTFINLIASFMLNSCRNWNNENLSEDAISEHMRILSGGKLELSPSEITILYHTKDSPRTQGGDRNFRNNNGRNNRTRNNGGGRNNRNNNGRNNRTRK